MSPASDPESIDPESPVPLYHQIAEAIRGRIVRGELQAGDSLEPMRRAAERWSVNLHTVRHAYAALAREGLLEMRSTRGTRVTGEAALLRRQGPEDVASFVSRVLDEARQEHGLRAEELAGLVAARAGRGRPGVALIECNAWQCAAHAHELAERWELDVKPWPLSQEAEPQAEILVSTYFHYNDIRRRWPHLLKRVKFLTVCIDETVVSWLQGVGSAVVVERDLPTAEAVAADLAAALGPGIQLRTLVTEDPAAAIAQDASEHILCSPRVWSDLDEGTRSRKECAVVRYRFDDLEREALARELAWRRTRTSVESL